MPLTRANARPDEIALYEANERLGENLDRLMEKLYERGLKVRPRKPYEPPPPPTPEEVAARDLAQRNEQRRLRIPDGRFFRIYCDGPLECGGIVEGGSADHVKVKAISVTWKMRVIGAGRTTAWLCPRCVVAVDAGLKSRG